LDDVLDGCCLMARRQQEARIVVLLLANLLDVGHSASHLHLLG